jgi:hypothetical protein
MPGSFYEKAVDNLIAEPDPGKRYALLEDLPSLTREEIEAVFAERVRVVLEAIEASGGSTD